MAIAFDAQIVSGALISSGTWTHTPVGTPRGVLILAVQALQDVAQVVDGDITYGGVNVPLIGSSVRSVGEIMRVDAFFLGSSIPTGAQTVSATFSNDVNGNWRGRSYTFTAGADTEVVDFDTVSSSVADPSVSLDNPSSRTCQVASVLSSGHGDVTGHAAGANYTSDGTVDPGLATARWAHLTAVSTSNPIVADYTQTIEDACMIAVALAEVAAGGGVETEFGFHGITVGRVGSQQGLSGLMMGQVP